MAQLLRSAAFARLPAPRAFSSGSLKQAPTVKV